MYKNANKYCVPVVFDADVLRYDSHGMQYLFGVEGNRDPASRVAEQDGNEDLKMKYNYVDSTKGFPSFQFGWTNEKDQNPFSGNRLITNLITRSKSYNYFDLGVLKIYKRKMKYL